MPRNVVTLVPRLLVWPSEKNRSAREAILVRLGERYRPRREDGNAELDFPKRMSGRAAKNQIAAELDRIDPRWRRLFVLYPTESSLRERGE